MNSLDIVRLDIELIILRAATRMLDDPSTDVLDVCAAREAAREGQYDYALHLLERARS